MLIALNSWSQCPHCSRLSADNNGQTKDLLALLLRLSWTSDHPTYLMSNESVLRHSDLGALMVDIQLDINQLNFRFYIERIQKRNESVASSHRS